jgi:hypothetical protein
MDYLSSEIEGKLNRQATVVSVGDESLTIIDLANPAVKQCGSGKNQVEKKPSGVPGAPPR